jgi:hypothetical protein
MTDDYGRAEFAERITNAIVNSYDEETIRRMVWDQTYDELIHLEWVDLMMYALDFGVYTDDESLQSLYYYLTNGNHKRQF